MIVYNNIESGMTEVYLGNQSIAQVYIGTNKVFPSDVPPTPYHFKAQYTLNDTTSGEAVCNGDSTLKTTDFGSVDIITNIIYMTVGECVDSFDTHLVSTMYPSLRTIDLTHSNITTVPQNFMNGVSTLRNAYLNESTTTISQYAFSGCTSLSAITIPSSITSINSNAFRNCGLKEITYYSGITYGTYVYSYCTSASALTIEQGTRRIEQGTFTSCTGLTSLTIPSSVSYIGTQAFNSCSGLTAITVNASNPPVLGSNAFRGSTCPIYCPCESLSLYQQEWADYASRLQCIPTYETQYLTMNVLGDGVFYTYRDNLSYSLDSGATWSAMTNGTEYPITANNKIYFKGNLVQDRTEPYNVLGCTGDFELEGNVMSLIFGDNFIGQTSLVGKDYAFSNLCGTNYLKSIKNLVLPATTLSPYCYAGMFLTCHYITEAPKLPATTLASGCYSMMFQECTSLTTAPDLPATTLADVCYYSMFDGCTSLTTAPVLPATTPAILCYQEMFKDCTSLNYIKCMLTDLSASQCILNWVKNVSSTGTFVKAQGIQWARANSGNYYQGIPARWTIEEV